MNDFIRPQPGIMDIELYQGGQAHVAGISDAIKLSSNENPFGPSDKAKEAFSRAVHKMHRYPNTDHASLRQAIGDVHGLDPDRIICGVGSDEIIHFLCQAYVGARDEVVFTEHGFLMYRISTMAAGGKPVSVPERERTTDVDAILKACNKKTRLVFLANPLPEYWLLNSVAQSWDEPPYTGSLTAATLVLAGGVMLLTAEPRTQPARR